jgi:thiol-disulfide isomerase/thioredoxin
MNVRWLRLAGGMLAALVGLWAGVRVYSTTHAPGGAPDHPARTASVRVPAGEASPPTQSDLGPSVEASGAPADEGGQPPSIPSRLPDFSLEDRAGKLTSIAVWRGKSLILNFWATWCAPCRREIPLLEALHREWGNRDVEVIGVAVDYRDKVLSYADELQIPYPLLIGEQDALDVAAKFGVTTPAFPFTVFTDRRGQIVTLYLGELHRAQVDLILSVVQNLNHNELQLDEARHTIAEGLHALAPEHPG